MKVYLPVILHNIYECVMFDPKIKKSKSLLDCASAAVATKKYWTVIKTNL